jgi:hypothetical protein
MCIEITKILNGMLTCFVQEEWAFFLNLKNNLVQWQHGHPQARRAPASSALAATSSGGRTWWQLSRTVLACDEEQPHWPGRLTPLFLSSNAAANQNNFHIWRKATKFTGKKNEAMKETGRSFWTLCTLGTPTGKQQTSLEFPATCMLWHISIDTIKYQQKDENSK